MKNDDIKTSTAVSHPDGGGYVIQRMSMNGAGEILTVAIGKDLHATAVFDGHPSEARKHGFLFGDEGRPGGLPHGTIVTHSAYPDRTYGYQPDGTSSGGMAVYRIMRDGVAVTAGTVDSLSESGFQFNTPEEVTVEEIEALLEPVEPEPSAMRRAWLASEEQVRELWGTVASEREAVAALTETIESREADIANLKAELSSARSGASDFLSRAQRAEANLDSFKERVRNEVESAKKEHDLCIDGCNSFLEELGLPRLARTWKVTVTRDWDNETVLTVTGVKADNESDAAEAVAESFTVTATVKEVRFDYEYDGQGDDDWDLSDFDDDDFDVTDDEYAESHKDGLTFTAEEE